MDLIPMLAAIQPMFAVSLISLIFLLVLVGVALWAINSFIPMDAKIKKILNVVVVVVVVLYLLYAFGILPADDITVPKIR